jgi:hypothetical protein
LTFVGERNWYLPAWLAWLPRTSLEGEIPESAAAAAERPDPQPALASVPD